MRAACTADLTDILKDGVTPETAAAFGKWVSEQFATGSNVRASADYRKKMIAVLTKRNVMELAEKAACVQKTSDAAEQYTGEWDITQRNEKGGPA